MATIDQLIRAAEMRKKAAERGVSDKKNDLKRYLGSLKEAGIADHQMDEGQVQRSTDLYEYARAAIETLKGVEGELVALRDVEADETRLTREASQVRSTGAPNPFSRETTQRPGESCLLYGADSTAGSWMREDGRPAVVERGQRFADHGVAREQIERASGRDNAIIGQYGDLGRQMRALTTSTGSAIVPTVWASEIIDRARNYAAVMKAGAQTIPMDAKIMQIGRLTADPAAGFRTEGSTITASDPTFDNVTLTAKSLNALVVGSTEFWQDASNAGELVTEAMAKALAVQIDLVALFGGVTAGAEQTATGNNMLASGGLPNPPNPSGILANLLANASSSVLGSQTNGTVQTAATFYGEVLDTIYTPRDFNESPNAMLWPSHLARAYAKAVDTQNNPMRVPGDVDSIQKFVTNQIPSGFTQGTGTLMSDLVVGDFSQLLVGQRLDLQVKVLDQRYAELGQTAILCSWRGDIGVARPRAFAVYRYIKGT